MKTVRIIFSIKLKFLHGGEETTQKGLSQITKNSFAKNEDKIILYVQHCHISFIPKLKEKNLIFFVSPT